jgi:hypothetical protein
VTQEQLKKCQGLIENDYFLADVKDKVAEQARMTVFEVYCRIHQRIDLDALAAQVLPPLLPETTPLPTMPTSSLAHVSCHTRRFFASTLLAWSAREDCSTCSRVM